MANDVTEVHAIGIGPLRVQRFGWHCFVWAWRRGQHRPVGKLFFGWSFRVGVWLGRDDDGDLTFTAALFGVHYDLTVTTWPEPSATLRAWAEEGM